MTTDEERIAKAMAEQGYVQTEDGAWIRMVKTPAAVICCVCHSKSARRDGRCEDCLKQDG